MLKWPVAGEVEWWFGTLESRKDIGSIPCCAFSDRVPGEGSAFVLLVEIYVVQSYIFLIGKLLISGELNR